MKRFKLSDLGTFKNGANYPRGCYGRGDKIINVKDLFTGRFVSEKGLDELKPGSLKNKDIYLVEDGDILFTRSSLVRSGAGMCAMVNKPTENMLFCGFIIRYRLNKELVYPLYLLYLLRSPQYRKLFTGTQQTNITNINQDTLGDISVLLPTDESGIPDVEKQKLIVNILENIDNKIENNNAINAELEALAKTIYDYWFLQFEFPNEDGLPYKSSGGRMVWSEELKREIPEGWGVGTLGDYGEIVAGGTPDTQNPDFYCEKGISWITPKDLSLTDNMYISRGERDITELGLKNSSAVLMPKGSVLMSSRAPIGYLAIALNEVTTNQGFKSIVPNQNYSSEFVYYTLKKYVPALIKKSGQTTFKEVSKSTLKEFSTFIPDVHVLTMFNSIIHPIGEKRASLEDENQELAALRDWLLPMLMNGQVTVE